MNMIKFREEDHTYWDGEKRIPGVSEILKATGASSSYYKGTAARDRGVEIHAATLAMDSLGLTPLDYSEELYQYLRAWDAFRAESGVELIEAERLVYHEAMGYAGTFDRIATKGGGCYMLDIKSGGPAAWHREQLAAYALARDSEAQSVGIAGGIVVYLKPTGRYSVKKFEGDEWVQAKMKWTVYVHAFNQEKEDAK